MRLTQVETRFQDEIEEGFVEGVLSVGNNHYVSLLRETPEGLELERRYHKTPYKNLEEAIKATKDMTYVYRN